MLRTHLFILTLATSLIAAVGCGDSDATSKALDKTIESATENVQNVADDTANALSNAAEDLGDVVEDAAQEVGKAIDNAGRKESNAK